MIRKTRRRGKGRRIKTDYSSYGHTHRSHRAKKNRKSILMYSKVKDYYRKLEVLRAPKVEIE